MPQTVLRAINIATRIIEIATRVKLSGHIYTNTPNFHKHRQRGLLLACPLRRSHYANTSRLPTRINDICHCPGWCVYSIIQLHPDRHSVQILMAAFYPIAVIGKLPISNPCIAAFGQLEAAIQKSTF